MNINGIKIHGKHECNHKLENIDLSRIDSPPNRLKVSIVQLLRVNLNNT